MNLPGVHHKRGRGGETPNTRRAEGRGGKESFPQKKKKKKHKTALPVRVRPDSNRKVPSSFILANRKEGRIAPPRLGKKGKKG